MKHNPLVAMAGFVALVALAGCAAVTTTTGTVREPSASTMAALQTGVTIADSLAFAYEQLPSTSSANRLKTEDAYTAINAAWASLQAGVKAGQPVDVTALESAIAGLESFASPHAITAQEQRAE